MRCGYFGMRDIPVTEILLDAMWMFLDAGCFVET